MILEIPSFRLNSPFHILKRELASDIYSLSSKEFLQVQFVHLPS